MKKLYSLIVALAALMALPAVAQDFTTLEGLCATYSWEGFDDAGNDLVFNISIKKDKTDNGVVISGMFGKYELKGTFDPSESSISIANQRVGFDPTNGQFLTFVHLTYDGDIDTNPLVLDNCFDGDLMTFEEYGVIAESMDGTLLLADGLIDYGYMAFIYRTGDNQITEWEEAGTATLFDGGFFTPLPRFGIGFKTPTEVPLEASTERENVYRLVNPWSGYFGREIESYLEFNISDPTNVIIPTQATGVTDEEYGAAYVQNFVGMYIAAGFGIDDAMAAIPTGKEGQHICTYNDAKKVITMPVGAMFTTFAKDTEGYWNVGTAFGATDSYIVLPGTSSVSDILTSGQDAPAEYFNLQGIRVNNPTPGQILIRRQGTTTTKIIK